MKPWVIRLALSCTGLAAPASAPAGERALTTHAVCGTAIGSIELVPGKFGTAGAFAEQRTDGKRRAGVVYPCNARTFAPKQGTFACWIKAPSYHCKTVFSTESDVFKFCMWHNKDEQGRYLFFPFSFIQWKHRRYNGAYVSRMEPGLWYHIAVTWDLANQRARGYIRTYVNGVTGKRAVRLEPPFDYTTGDTLTIGQFNCAMDDVVILDQVLDLEGIRRMFFSAPFVPDKHTTLHVSFDEGTADGVTTKHQALQGDHE